MVSRTGNTAKQTGCPCNSSDRIMLGHLQGLPLPIFQNTVEIRQADNRLLPFYRLNSAWIVPIVILISPKNHQERPWHLR